MEAIRDRSKGFFDRILGFSLLYLTKINLQILEQDPKVKALELQRRAISKLLKLSQYDSQIIHKHYGFNDLDEYYDAGSNYRKLKNIQIPTLLLMDKDDPVIGYETAIPYEAPK
jgi:predicted alpha/beta-fold hydrolase